MSKSDNTTRVLIPGVCHPIAGETLERLRHASGGSLYIVGVDLEERGHDHGGVDIHYFVPPATSPDFVPVVLDLCRKERVDLVVPWSDIEVEAISGAADSFRDAGVATLCAGPEQVQRTLDKVATLETLRDHGIAVPAFMRAQSSDDVEQAAAQLGYPETAIVVKPRRSSGCRGLWVLKADAEILRHCGEPGLQATLGAFLSIMRECERNGSYVPEYVVMEFLPGDDYSVDALANEGEAIYVVPRRRIHATEGISRVGET